MCIVLEWAGGEGQVGERRRTRNRKRKSGLRVKPTDINTVMSIMSLHANRGQEGQKHGMIH